MMLQSKTFLRYMLSYALVLFLPMLVLCMVFYFAALDRFTEEVTLSNSRALEQVQEGFDAQLEQIVHLSYLIQNNASLHPAAIGSDIMAARSAVNTLSTYKSITTLPELIMVYAENSDMLYTNAGVLSLERFFSQQYVYSAHTRQDFEDAVSSKNGIVTWGSDMVEQYGGQKGEYITLFIAVQSGNISPKIRSIYLIPVKRLRQATEGIAAQYGGHVYVFDQHHRVVMGEPGALAEVPVTGMEEIVRQAGPQRVMIDHQEYLLSGALSKIVGWQYVFAIPVAEVEAPLNSLLLRMALIMAVVILLGGWFVYWFSMRQYKPLHQLRQQALAYAPAGSGTELEQVSAVLRQLSRDSDNYRNRLENSREALLQNCLSRLLRGDNERAMLLERAKENGADLTASEVWTVIALDFSCDLGISAAKAVRAALLSESFRFDNAILCENPPDSGMAVMLLPGLEDDWEGRLFPLQDYLQKTLGCSVAFGVSLSCSADTLAEAYRQATLALEGKLIRGNSCIAVYSSEQESGKAASSYPLKELEALQWNLLQLDAEATTRCIHTIMEGISKSGVSFPVARMICFDVINVTLHSLYAVTDNKSIHPTDSMLERLSGFETIHELVTLLEELIHTACTSMGQMSGETGDERLECIRQYVEENCFDPEFSIYSTARHFALTPSNLSHYFKNLTGQSISDYVQALRRAEACRLLTETSDSIQLIGQKTGMLNVSSFIRSFKQQTGLTPGQYRSRSAKISKAQRGEQQTKTEG